MNNTFEYRFSKIELEQFATFEENFQCEKEISFQTNTSFSFDKNNMIFISRIGVCATQMEKPILKAEQVCYFELSSETVNSLPTSYSRTNPVIPSIKLSILLLS